MQVIDGNSYFNAQWQAQERQRRRQANIERKADLLAYRRYKRRQHWMQRNDTAIVAVMLGVCGLSLLALTAALIMHCGNMHVMACQVPL